MSHRFSSTRLNSFLIHCHLPPFLLAQFDLTSGALELLALEARLLLRLLGGAALILGALLFSFVFSHQLDGTLLPRRFVFLLRLGFAQDALAEGLDRPVLRRVKIASCQF